MKKFFFSLDTVLSYKEQVLDGLKAEHAKVLVRLRQCEDEIDRLENVYQNGAKEFDEKKRTGIDVQDIRIYDNFLRGVRQQIKRKREELLEIKKEEEKRWEKVVEAKKESSSLDKLKEKQLEEYNKQMQKENEQMIEEFVSTQSAFARMNG